MLTIIFLASDILTISCCVRSKSASEMFSLENRVSYETIGFIEYVMKRICDCRTYPFSFARKFRLPIERRWSRTLNNGTITLERDLMLESSIIISVLLIQCYYKRKSKLTIFIVDSSTSSKLFFLGVQSE